MNIFESIVHAFPPNPTMMTRERRHLLPGSSSNQGQIQSNIKKYPFSSTIASVALDDSTTWKSEDLTVTIEQNKGVARTMMQKYESPMLLGHGTFGVVFKMRERVSGTETALKIVCKESMLQDYDNRMELLHREYYIQKGLMHNHIVRLYDHWEDEKSFYFSLEYAALGDLEYFRRKKTMRRTQQVSFIRQITAALEHIASLGIAHRDIKGENCLVFSNDTIKLADFGWAVLLPHGNYFRATLCGTPDFVPPEMILGDGIYDARYVDRWSLGVLAWELMESRGLFELTSEMRAGYAKPRHATFALIRAFVELDVTKAVDSECADFCSKLLVLDPSRRMSFLEGRRHPLIQATIASGKKKRRRTCSD